MIPFGIPINGWKNGGDPHERVEEGDPHQRVEEGDPSHHELEIGICSSEMEMKSKISIIIKTGFRPL